MDPCSVNDTASALRRVLRARCWHTATPKRTSLLQSGDSDRASACLLLGVGRESTNYDAIETLCRRDSTVQERDTDAQRLLCDVAVNSHETAHIFFFPHEVLTKLMQLPQHCSPSLLQVEIVEGRDLKFF